MSSSSDAYRFRPATDDDLPMLRAWLRTPDVVQWWGDPDREAATLEEDLREPRMVMSIVSFAGRPFAYVQHYELEAWPQPHFAELPRGTRAVDAFIGEPDMLGCGHGAIFLRLLARQLMADGAPAVAIDPDVDNARARRAYARAGFCGDRIVQTDEGPAVLMLFSG
jgi:aminoglycoside 6'-N-acetyltransferase